MANTVGDENTLIHWTCEWQLDWIGWKTIQWNIYWNVKHVVSPNFKVQNDVCHIDAEFVKLWPWQINSFKNNQLD